MKAVEWVRYLTDQRDRHGKGVFTVTELANVADATPAVLNVQLGRLVRQGLIRRWVPGRYGLPDGVTAEEQAAAIDADAYVTATADPSRRAIRRPGAESGNEVRPAGVPHRRSRAPRIGGPG